MCDFLLLSNTNIILSPIVSQLSHSIGQIITFDKGISLINVQSSSVISANITIHFRLRKYGCSFNQFDVVCFTSSSAVAERPCCSLQGGSALAKSERQYFAEIIGLSLATVT